MSELELENSKTYDTVVILMAANDTVCPEWLKPKLEFLIGECFDRLPERMEIVNYEPDEVVVNISK